MKVAYVRVSTIEQNEGRQLESLKKYDIEKWFEEKVSGKDTNRPQLQSMLDFVREGDTIYIHDFSRLARSTKDLLEIIERLQKKNVALISVKENFDTSTPTGKLMVTVIAAINEFERTNLLERQREGIAIAKGKGVYKGRKPITFTDEEFMNELLGEIKKGISNPLSNENFLINTMTKNDPNGKKIVGNIYNFKTNNLSAYFYIVLYHIVLNDIDYIKRCQICGRYFFSDKNTTLYCNGKYTDGITCKEYGIKTSQKRKENEEPVYGKYRQIYAKKAMAVKRNPDIEYYKTTYEKWKKEAKQFINDIKSGKKSYDEFDEWLDKSK